MAKKLSMVDSVGYTMDVLANDEKKECLSSSDTVGECNKSSVHYSSC